jgi:hypothetical protein
MADNDDDAATAGADASEDGTSSGGTRRLGAKRALLVCSVVFGAVGVVAVVSSQEEHDPAEVEGTATTATALRPEGWTEIDEPEGLEPLALSDQPAWGAEDGPVPEPSGLVVSGDAVVLAEARMRGYVIADAASGEERWRLTFGEPLPELDGADAGPRLSDLADVDMYRSPLPVTRSGSGVVAVDYERTRCGEGCPTFLTTVEVGIAAFSLEDGELAWKAPYDFPPVEEGGAVPLVRDVTAGGSTVVASVEEPDEAGVVLPRLQLVAYDAADGSLRWKVGGFAPIVVTADVVVAQRDGDGDDPFLVAFDAETGRQLWSRGGEDISYFLHAAVGQVAVLGVFDRELGSSTVAVDVTTGDELVDLGPTGHCATDGETLVACGVDGPEPGTQRIATFHLQDGATGVSAEPFPEGTSVVGLLDGRIVVGDDDQATTVDRSGAAVSALPGAFHSASDTYAVFGCRPVPEPDCSGYSVHRLD